MPQGFGTQAPAKSFCNLSSSCIFPHYTSCILPFPAYFLFLFLYISPLHSLYISSSCVFPITLPVYFLFLFLHISCSCIEWMNPSWQRWAKRCNQRHTRHLGHRCWSIPDVTVTDWRQKWRGAWPFSGRAGHISLVQMALLSGELTPPSIPSCVLVSGGAELSPSSPVTTHTYASLFKGDHWCRLGNVFKVQKADISVEYFHEGNVCIFHPDKPRCRRAEKGKLNRSF